MAQKRTTLRERRARAVQSPAPVAPVAEPASEQPPASPMASATQAPARTRRATMNRVGITIAPEDLEQARAAFQSDLDRLAAAPPSLTRWIARAVQRHLDRTPADRRETAAAHPGTGSETRKIPYNVPIPIDMHQDLRAAIKEERQAGRSTHVSGLIREAIAIEVDAARTRAGGTLPTVEGPLPHAR